MKRFLLVLGLAALLIGVPGGTHSFADTGDKIYLRVSMLVPRTSMGVVESKRWEKRVKKATNDRLRIKMYWGGTSGDERAVIRKMRMGQVDASALTTISLGDHIKQVQIMNAPGLFANYRQLDEAFKELSPAFDKEAYDQGFKVMGWGDAGKYRLFSQQPIKKPSDVRRMRPWLWPEALMMKEFFRVIGATGVPMEIPEVYAGLQTGMIDTVLASALTSLATLWFTKTPYVSNQGGGYITGAFVIARKKFEEMPKDISDALSDLAAKYQHQVVYNLRKADLDAFKRLLKRGITSVKVDNFSEWQALMDKITDGFVGRLYSRQMLKRVKAICKKYHK